MADDTKTQQGGTINLKGMGAAGSGNPPAGGGTATATKDDSKFKIPDEVKKKYPDLIELIKQTESMTDEERTYWFQIMPIMTDQQIEKLKKILLQEKAQLQKLDAEYEKELKKLNDKHLLEWKEFEARKSREERQKAEAAEEAKEKAAEEDILSQLDEV